MNKEFYKIYSLIFHRPDREFARYLRDGFIEDIGFLDSDAVTGFSEFMEETKEKSDEEFYNLIAVEYTRLFINAIPNVPCPPYESVYREGTVMGDSTLDVLACYNKAGLKITNNFHDLPDHIAVELEFLYYLADTGNTEMHDSFMQKHFSKWFPEFCKRVEENDRTGFYRHACTVLGNLIS
ncbi:putative component of anaerobic dehydrogenase [Candidatus Methanoperedens nitroreducens]|uniref:Putative component of anaerobic dehydrogenase n=1 Tax=Candidatus Methanoperedens nitratireducens TaxID=1392998 RepID=A0A062V2L7_9EURY|nr:molecular chaperone TorD family protein [Candidatus Methanoperedens nitroreducens]KCZ73336.1 putative component of anaerobic dehydrogenase [Candidatus Methanoperedens nitroreducens]MDJ1422716.1 molecular chaperone TorD family protein [Candidatus Methanoperedens sp.]